MESTEVFRRNPEFLLREVVGEAILVPTGAAGLQFSGMGTMNATGTFLWNLLEQPRSLGELSGLFAREYELTPEQSLQDVSEFLQMALSRGAVVRL
ncbi:MAG: PqqD family protein [Firmicutes bacterium]|nr:PqqD family protein [Bacillota bacterium]